MSGTSFEIHEHVFVSGPRSNSGLGKDGHWYVGGEHIRHSHPGGDVPHTHENTGPSFYGHGKRKYTKRPNGEQLVTIAQTEEESSFELVITDSALRSEGGKLVPIGNIPIESTGFMAAQTMMCGFKLKCIVRDERKSDMNMKQRAKFHRETGACAVCLCAPCQCSRRASLTPNGCGNCGTPVYATSSGLVLHSLNGLSVCPTPCSCGDREHPCVEHPEGLGVL